MCQERGDPMAGISTSIQLNDRMTPVLQSITSAMNLMVGSFDAAQTASATAVNTAQWTAAVDAVHNASAAVAEYQQELERAQSKTVNVPEPSWDSVSTPQVFVNSGAERFQQEIQSVNQMVQQLYKNQQAITAQAGKMRVIPPGMNNDMTVMANRVQGLSARIEQLNNIPVDLQTDHTNHELESLRGKLSQAMSSQKQLNIAMSQMDISAANAAYRQLNSIMDTTERNIRDNFAAQEQFNQSVNSGRSAANGLGSSIKRYAVMLLSAATAGKALSLADQVTQTTARLDLMNYGLDSTEQLQQKIFQSAQRSRGVYQTTADAVAKLGMQARGAFSSNDELIAFAEQLNKSFVVAGTSAQGVDSVMLQLTQAMAAGKLQGEELNAVLDNAQLIVQNIADYMGVPVGQIKQLASEGKISAEIIKNAMFAAADETNTKFEQMPMTFGQVASNIRNQALMAFQPALQQLSAVTQTAEFQSLVGGVTMGIQAMAQIAVTGLELMGQAALFVQENWSWLAPVIAGITAAVLAYNAAMLINNTMTTISTALKTGETAGSLLAAAAIFMQTLAQQGLNAAIASCPMLWIALVIGVVIAAIVAWIRSVGGMKVAWLICVNAVMTKAEQLQLGFSSIWVAMQNGLDRMSLGFAGFKVGVLNALGNLKVLGLTILQNFINGAIDRINKLIGFAQKIGVTSIDMIAHVEFATSAAVEEKAAQQQRASDLAVQRYQTAADIADRAEGIRMKKSAFEAAQERRLSEIEATKAESESKKSAKDVAEESWYNSAPLDSIAGNTGNTAANTAAMADAMDVMDEDLKYMRDIAEQEIINRFTLSELKVDVNNNNTLTKKADFDDMGSFLSTFTSEFLAAAAEGGHV